MICHRAESHWIATARIIAVTGAGRPNPALTAEVLNGPRFLGKPFTAETLLHAIQGALHR